jgi:hypothetical protein
VYDPGCAVRSGPAASGSRSSATAGSAFARDGRNASATSVPVRGLRRPRRPLPSPRRGTTGERATSSARPPPPSSAAISSAPPTLSPAASAASPGRPYAENLRRAGVEVELRLLYRDVHGFFEMTASLPAARRLRRGTSAVAEGPVPDHHGANHVADSVRIFRRLGAQLGRTRSRQPMKRRPGGGINPQIPLGGLPAPDGAGRRSRASPPDHGEQQHADQHPGGEHDQRLRERRAIAVRVPRRRPSARAAPWRVRHDRELLRRAPCACPTTSR